MTLREDADFIIKESIAAVLPDEAVERAISGKQFGPGKLYLVSIGKAGWQMANKAAQMLGNRLEDGVVCTKYDHVTAPIPNVTCYEGGHPVPDANSFKGTQAAIDMVSGLSSDDTVIFLISGGGSALFEKPLIPEEELQDMTRQLLACGADITEINTLRKRVSAVKGGKFAKLCEPAQVFCIVLSDILGDPLDMIASGPAYADTTTCQDALDIIQKYQLNLSASTMKFMTIETPKHLSNVETVITGSVSNLCTAAAAACKKCGYEPFVLSDHMDCQAKEAGYFLASVAASHQHHRESVAFIAGGETVVQLTGKGLGGRNQELALAAAEKIGGLSNTAVFSIGSDGTDGPTDAAGGYVDQNTSSILNKQNISIHDVLYQNDAYHALQKCNGLIVTGPTGTNVNDVAVVLIKR